MEKVKTKNNQKLFLEILRFVIVGVICTLLDFGVNLLFLNVLPNNPAWVHWRQIIAITSGFIVGVIANYLLSTFFVFKNVKDDKKAKTPLYIFLFVLLSAVGLGLNYAIYYAFYALFMLKDININISFNFTKELWSSLEFWMYVITFVIKTLIVLVYNYLTRKFIIYKAPKKEV